MKFLLKSFFLFLLLFSIAPQLEAHDSNQISYIFEREDEMGILTIHLTPKGVIDLLVNIQPELQDIAVIQPNEHYETLTNYFNETIDLKLDDKHIDFKFIKADLTVHDATMTFQLQNFGGSYEGFEVSVSSFTEVYKRTKNHVVFEMLEGEKNLRLTY